MRDVIGVDGAGQPLLAVIAKHLATKPVVGAAHQRGSSARCAREERSRSGSETTWEEDSMSNKITGLFSDYEEVAM